jgi:5-methylcytosine-specific restriction endonuclease McrA
MKKIKSIPRTQIRYMLKRQNGRCAISGEKLSPVNVSVDHIFPLSRKEFENEKLYGKSWLVTSSINRLKGSLTLDELYQLIEKIKNHSINTKELFKELNEEEIKEMSKDEFDEYIKNNYDENGIIKE